MQLKIKIALLVITHTILHSSPKVRRSAPQYTTKTTFASVTFPIELNVTLGHAHF